MPPGATGLGGVPLLAHNRAIGDAKEALLVEFPPLAGAARLVEPRGAPFPTAPAADAPPLPAESRAARRAWPACLAPVGPLRLVCREA